MSVLLKYILVYDIVFPFSGHFFIGFFFFLLSFFVLVAFFPLVLFPLFLHSANSTKIQHCLHDIIDIIVRCCFNQTSTCSPSQGALKLKEMTYLHAEGYSGSALKHGPFALIEGPEAPGGATPIILLILDDEHAPQVQ